MLDFGREITGDLAAAERREWLCANGIGGFASGTVAGTLTRRYHGLLVAALKPPLGRTLLVSKVEDRIEYGGTTHELSVNRWTDGTIAPAGHRALERFHLDGTTPVWTYACHEALVEKRVWMEPEANTAYVRYTLLRGPDQATLDLRALVNYRDYHGTTRGAWSMDVAKVPHGVSVIAFAGARPLLLLADGTNVLPAHAWYHGFDLLRERERGLDASEDHLHAATFRASLTPGQSLTLVLSAEPAPSLDGEQAWRRRARHDDAVLETWRRARSTRESSPPWIERLVQAADQFIVRRPTADEPEGMTVIAGYHWFGDWGRDTMIALPGLALTTGRPEVARRILTTFARFVDHGLLPNRFPDAGEEPEYNTVDATLWYFEAIRAYHAATGDDGLLKELFPALASIIGWHRDGTRHGIKADPTDALVTSGEPGVQLTWMDAKVGDWVVTPRMGKAVEINALWYNALHSMVHFARRIGRPAHEWETLAERVKSGFQRFWNEAGGYCHDVIDTSTGDDPTLRPNQIFAVSLSQSPLSMDRQRRVVEACARHLLTSHGLRTLAPGHPQYRGHYGGDQLSRDGAYHQGTAWPWLLGPFALAHYKVYGDAEAGLSFLKPLAHHVADYGLGSIAEIFDGDAPFEPRGCIAQAWSVAETLRAWHDLRR